MTTKSEIEYNKIFRRAERAQLFHFIKTHIHRGGEWGFFSTHRQFVQINKCKNVNFSYFSIVFAR